MNNCTRTNSKNDDFQKLVRELDEDLKIRDGEEHLFYAQFNKTDTLNYVIVAYDQDQPIGCGALREYSEDTMEVKRMYVLPNRRGQGIASTILKELECWAIELNYKKCLLETGKNQPEAIAFYKKNGYKIIPNFGQYENAKNSVCFDKLFTEQEI
jgi:GNAT superfamily N-acetyltransferase